MCIRDSPKDCTKELIDTIASCEKVCNHIYLPVQSGSNRVLKLMNRHYTVEWYKELIAYARQRIPGVLFTTCLFYTSLEGVVRHAPDDLFGKVGGVVFRIALKDGFENDALRAL